MAKPENDSLANIMKPYCQSVNITKVSRPSTTWISWLI